MYFNIHSGRFVLFFLLSNSIFNWRFFFFKSINGDTYNYAIKMCIKTQPFCLFFFLFFFCLTNFDARKDTLKKGLNLNSFQTIDLAFLLALPSKCFFKCFATTCIKTHFWKCVSMWTFFKPSASPKRWLTFYALKRAY